MTITCYIVDKKANNFSKTFGFAVTIAIAIYDSLCVCVLSTLSAFFVFCLLFVPCPLCLYLRLRLPLHLLYLGCLFYLRLPWFVLFASAICVLSATSAFSVARLLSMPRPLRLHLL